LRTETPPGGHEFFFPPGPRGGGGGVFFLEGGAFLGRPGPDIFFPRPRGLWGGGRRFPFGIFLPGGPTKKGFRPGLGQKKSLLFFPKTNTPTPWPGAKGPWRDGGGTPWARTPKSHWTQKRQSRGALLIPCGFPQGGTRKGQKNGQQAFFFFLFRGGPGGGGGGGAAKLFGIWAKFGQVGWPFVGHHGAIFFRGGGGGGYGAGVGGGSRPPGGRSFFFNKKTWGGPKGGPRGGEGGPRRFLGFSGVFFGAKKKH